MVSTVDRVPPQRSWDTREREVAICAALLWGGEVRGRYHKVLLPFYDVFDEARHFAARHRIDDAELTRRYAPPGVKVTARAFGQDRRMPINNVWRAHLRNKPAGRD